MSKLARLKLSGIRSFGCDEGDEQEIKFSCPVTLFLGQNGCGKTTIIEAIKFAITGDLPGGVKGGQGFIYDPKMAKTIESRGQVKLKIYDMQGQSFTVTKVAKVRQERTKLSFKLMDSTLSRGGQPITLRCADIHRDICLSLGVPKAILNMVLFCHQEDSHWPLEEPKKLKERFDAIFDSTRYNKCIENMIKVRKTKTEAIKQLTLEVDVSREYKTQMEKKRAQLDEKETRYTNLTIKLSELEESIEPIQKRLDEIYSLEKVITEIEAKIMQLQGQLKNNQEQQRDILSQITEMKCSTEELEEKIDSFERDQTTTNEKMEELNFNLNEIEGKEKSVRNEINKDQIKLGRLQAEERENDRKIRSRKVAAEEIIQEYEISADPEDINTSFKMFKTHLKTSESRIQDFIKQSDKMEKELQNQIDEYRTKHAQYKQNIETKTKYFTELRNEFKKVSQKLEEISTYDGELQNIESRLSRLENDLTQTESQVNIEDLKEEIENDKRKYNSLEDQLQKVENEIQIMQTYVSAQAELDIQKENLTKKESELKKLKMKHTTSLEHIFDNDVPEINIKSQVEKYVNKQNDKIKELNQKITYKQKEVTQLETKLNVQEDKLLTMNNDLTTDSRIIKEYFNDETYEKKLSEAKEEIESNQKIHGLVRGSKHIYDKYLKAFKAENPTCPVCFQNVRGEDLLEKIFSSLEKQNQSIPKHLLELEQKVTYSQKSYSKICELKPVYDKVENLKEKIPQQKAQVIELEDKLNSANRELNNLKKELKTPLENQEIANQIMGDVSVMDQNISETKKINTEITSLEASMPKTETKRSMQEAQYEQDNLRSSIKSTRLNIDSLEKKLLKHNQRLQNLKDQKNDLKIKELKIKNDLQGKDQLDNKRKELASKILQNEKELSEIQEELEPTKKKLDEAVKNKEKRKTEDKIQKDEMEVKYNKFKTKLEDIKRLSDGINNFMQSNITEEISNIKELIEKYNAKLSKYSKTKTEINEMIQDLKDQVINKKTYFRELQDNVKIREKRVQATKILDHLKEAEKTLGNHNIQSLKREKYKFETKLTECEKEIGKSKGQQTELQNSVQEAKEELSKPIYTNAIKKFETKFLEHSILTHSIQDLTTFIKAVDWSMLQYHKQQMVYINETIRDLWRSVYRGNDIDYIEICTESENSTRKNDNRRTYTYRLVQVKNDVKLDMRGRCSAGQRVLASLIIRIALADTFSTKCGILALDEPTTNLDKENISSLCEALCELVARKKNQKNFQLLIITHDQEFLERLSRNILIENYYLVSRNEQGKSMLTVKNANF